MEDAHFLHATHIIIIIIRLHDGRNSLHPTVVLLIKVILLLELQMWHSKIELVSNSRFIHCNAASQLYVVTANVLIVKSVTDLLCVSLSCIPVVISIADYGILHTIKL